MALLETILPRNGNALVDPSKQSAFLFQNWPDACSFNWRSTAITPDPFFIEAISLAVNHDPGKYKTSLTDVVNIHAVQISVIPTSCNTGSTWEVWRVYNAACHGKILLNFDIRRISCSKLHYTFPSINQKSLLFSFLKVLQMLSMPVTKTVQLH